MGRVRTKVSYANGKVFAMNIKLTIAQTVKKSAKVIIERYYPKLTLDFETNKRICDEIAIIASKRLRNKVKITISARCYFSPSPPGAELSNIRKLE